MGGLSVSEYHMFIRANVYPGNFVWLPWFVNNDSIVDMTWAMFEFEVNLLADKRAQCTQTSTL